MTLPFPKYNINSFSIIICFIFWLLYNPWKVKFGNLKKHFLLFLLLSSLFWIALIGLTYTQDVNEGLKKLQQKIPFVLFPLIFLSINFNKRDINFLFKYFSYSVVLASLFALTKACYFRFNNLGNFFYYDQLSIVLDKHTTYYSLFTVLSILYFTNEILKKKIGNNIKEIIFIAFLFLMLYFLSVRISIVSLICAFFVLIFNNDKISKKKRIGFLLITFTTFLIYLTPNFQQRFNAEAPNGAEISDVELRWVHWKSVVETIFDNNLFFGAGTGDGHFNLYKVYKENNFESGYVHKYNAHNQFLEIVLYFGLLGLFIFVCMFYILLKKNIKHTNNFETAIIVVFLIFMSTESILERHSGIVLFAYLMSALSACAITEYNTTSKEFNELEE